MWTKCPYRVYHIVPGRSRIHVEEGLPAWEAHGRQAEECPRSIHGLFALYPTHHERNWTRARILDVGTKDARGEEVALVFFQVRSGGEARTSGYASTKNMEG